MWIGIDDTDGPNGGCTTFVLTEVVRAARSIGVDLIGEPRLVRLNPNIPWKTRGNAALSARFGRGSGRRRKIGELSEGSIWSYARGSRLDRSTERALLDATWEAVVRSSEHGPGTDPAFVATVHRPPASLYWAAVRSVVKVPDVRGLLRSAGATVRTLGSPRGLVGAAAAIAWPGHRGTWELIAYRKPSRIGLPREVNVESIRTIEAAYPAVFLCTDPTTRRLLVTPHTNCPILFGLRATDGGTLLRAVKAVRSEPWERWLRFRTNQATGDHLTPTTVTDLGPFESGRLRGSVASPIRRLRGGHVAFDLVETGGGRIACFVFEPTKTLTAVARDLAVGDQLTVWGGRGRDRALRVEGIEIRASVLREGARRPPRCSTCGRMAGSLGTGRGYRCKNCRRRFPLESGRSETHLPLFGVGIYHPTPSARRHLHPLADEPHRRRDGPI